MNISIIFEEKQQTFYLTLVGHVVCLEALERSLPVLGAALALEEAALEVNTEAVTGSGAGYLSLLF